jgi:hypothetical protein
MPVVAVTPDLGEDIARSKMCRRVPMYKDPVVYNYELASLIYEQTKLTSKTTTLTPEEEQLFQLLDNRIEQLLGGSTSNRRAQWRTPIVRWTYLN